jgi:hypothetical protein
LRRRLGRVPGERAQLAPDLGERRERPIVAGDREHAHQLRVERPERQRGARQARRRRREILERRRERAEQILERRHGTPTGMPAS